MGIAITAGILLVNKNNEVLIAHPTNHDPNFWSIPKGKTEDGESLWETALRETQEETNVVIDINCKYHEQPRVTYKHKKKAVHIFIVLENENSDIMDLSNLDLQCLSMVEPEIGGFPEMDDFKWVTIDEAKAVVHYTQLAALTALTALISLK